MSKTYQSSASKAAGSQTTSTAFNAFSATTGRSLIVFIMGGHVSGYDCSGVSDGTNTYTRIGDTGLFGSSRNRCIAYVAHNITGGSLTITVSHTQTSANGVAMTVSEFSATSALSTDKYGTAYDDTSPVSATATASGANTDTTAIVFGFGGWSNAAAEITGTIDGDFTSVYTTITATDYRANCQLGYRICSAGETSAYTATVSSTDTALGAMVVTFAEAGSTTKYLKALIASAAAGATSVAGTVFNAPTGGDITGTKIGEFIGQSFLGANSLDGGKAKLLVNVSSFGGSALTTANTPHVYLRTSSFDTGIFPATVIEV